MKAQWREDGAGYKDFKTSFADAYFQSRDAKDEPLCHKKDELDDGPVKTRGMGGREGTIVGWARRTTSGDLTARMADKYRTRRSRICWIG